MKNLYYAMFTGFVQPKRCATYLFLSTFSMLILCCRQDLLEQTSVEKAERSARLSSEPLFSTSYEVEEYTATQILSKLPAESVSAHFQQIASQPRLDRQKIEFALFEDGTYQITTTQLQPTKTDLLPPSLRARKAESILAHKTVLRDGIARFYDNNGNEIGKAEFNNNTYAILAEKIMKSNKITEGQVNSELMGHPLINEEYVLAIASEKQADIHEDRGITKIKFDLSKFSAESNEREENLATYAEQYYDFKNSRLLGETLTDKKSNQILYKSTLFYSTQEKGNHVEKVYSETFNEDPQTRLKTRLIKETYYSNVITTSNKR